MCFVSIVNVSMDFKMAKFYNYNYINIVLLLLVKILILNNTVIKLRAFQSVDETETYIHLIYEH